MARDDCRTHSVTQADRQPEAANDRGLNDVAQPAEVMSKALPASPYYFEICQIRPQNVPAKSLEVESWLWRLISPVGAASIECGGYSDEESCRTAVALLREKAAQAEISGPVF
jgi:uncharacterized protein YegP (UPF0339 family)